MILKYDVKNFYSIGEEGAGINFTVDGNAPQTDLYVNTGEVAGRVSLTQTVIGPNASGKTQLLKGIPFIKHMITASYRDDPTHKMMELFTAHMSLVDHPTEISVRFIVSARVFEYVLTSDSNIILSEELKEYSKSTERVTAKTIASRKWSHSEGEYKYIDKGLGALNSNDLRRNASMVASAMQKEKPSTIAKLVSDYWSDNVLVHNVWIEGNREDAKANKQLLRDNMTTLFHADNTALLDQVKTILRKYDIGFDDFHEQVIQIPDIQNFSVYYVDHKFKDSNFRLSLDMESSGTKRLISTLTSIVDALLIREGGVAIVDEIDAFMHPDVVEALVELFMHPDTNPNKTQLLFSTHNHRILETLDKQQIILTEKNEEGKTESWRLDEMDDVKSTDNFYSKYVTGAYGARPKIQG